MLVHSDYIVMMKYSLSTYYMAVILGTNTIAIIKI